MNQKIRLLIEQLAPQLQVKGYEYQHAVQMVWWVIQTVTQVSQLEFATCEKGVSSEHEATIKSFIDRHIHEDYPLQYLLKTVSFADLTIQVEPPVLIPRPETEAWVMHLITDLVAIKDRKLTILDMCTGSGCIGLAFAQALPNAKVTLVDKAPHAIALAHKNMLTNNLSNAFSIESDLYINLPEHHFDLIVSNPPYITSAEWEVLDPVVKRWEDKGALEAGDNGLSVIRPLIDQAMNYLKTENVMDKAGLPCFVIEIGYMQGAIVQELCLQAGFKRVAIVKDFAGLDRIVVCYRS